MKKGPRKLTKKYRASLAAKWRKRLREVLEDKMSELVVHEELKRGYFNRDLRKFALGIEHGLRDAVNRIVK